MAEHELIARHHENVLNWLVSSRSRPEVEHRVDLAAYGGNGRCSCEHFQFRIEPGLRDGSRHGGDRSTRCKHILVARESFCDAMLAWAIETQKKRAERAKNERR